MLNEAEKVLSPMGSETRVEARIALICAFILAIALYTSSFKPEISLLIIAIACLSSGLKALRAIALSTPFLVFFAASSYLLRGNIIHSATMTLGFASLVAIGSVIASIPPAELSCALIYFRVPYRFAFFISLAVRMFRVYIRDLKQAGEAMKLSGEKGFALYAKLLRAMASIAVLRSVAIAETLYSRGFSGKAECFNRELSRFDCLVLLLSAFVFVYSVCFCAGLV